MSKKHFYIKFSDDVPNSIEKHYNRILRREEYLLEKDPLGSAVFFGNEDELYKYNIVGYIISKENEQNRSDNGYEFLTKALDKMKKVYPMEYEVLESYYLSENHKSIIEIANDRGISKQAVSKLLSRAKKHLKTLVIYYKNKR